MCLNACETQRAPRKIVDLRLTQDITPEKASEEDKIAEAQPEVPAAQAIEDSKVSEAPIPEAAQLEVQGEIQGEILREKDFFDVGLLIPMSGTHHEIGRNIFHAALLALHDYNQNDIRFIIQDSKGNGLQASQGLAWLIRNEVKSIIGPVFAHEAYPLSQQLKIADLIAFTLSNDESLANPNLIVMGILPTDRINVLIKHAQEQKISKFLLLAPESTYGDLMVSQAQKILKEDEIRVLRYSPQDIALTKIIHDPLWQAYPWEALIIGETGSRFIRLHKILEGHGLVRRNTKILAVGAWSEQTKNSYKLPRDVMIAVPQTPEHEAFRQRYIKEFKCEPLPIASIMYDTVALLIHILKEKKNRESQMMNCQNCHNKVNYAMFAQDRGYKGINGVFYVEEPGMVKREMRVLN